MPKNDDNIFLLSDCFIRIILTEAFNRKLIVQLSEHQPVQKFENTYKKTIRRQVLNYLDDLLKYLSSKLSLSSIAFSGQASWQQ